MYFFRPDENKNLTYTVHEPTIAPARNSELHTKLATRVVDSYSSKARQRLSLRTMHKYPTIRQETTTSDINFPNLCQHTGGAEVCCELSMPISERAESSYWVRFMTCVRLGGKLVPWAPGEFRVFHFFPWPAGDNVI